MKTSERRAARPSSTGIRQAPFMLRDTGSGVDGDGWTLDGYGAVFNTLTVIDSWEGVFREQIANRSMNKSFRENPPIVQFDHGRHPLIGSFPIAELLSAKEESDPVLAPDGGAHIEARIFEHLFFEPLREAIAAQAIKGMSFRFEVVREKWQYADGSNIKNDDDLLAELRKTWSGTVAEEDLPIRTLQELKVPEIGPVVWPAYTETSVGVRNQVINLAELDSDEGQRIALARKLWAMPKLPKTNGDANSVRMAVSANGVPYPVRDADDDPASLAAALDATLDQICDLLDGVDMTTLPTDVAQACALMVAAETVADELLEVMGVYDADDDEAGEPADTGGSVDETDADDDPTALVGALDALLDQIGELIVDVDLSTLPEDVAQACSLMVAAETVADQLSEAMNVYDPDSDETGQTGRSKNVDGQFKPSRKKDAPQATGKRSAGEHPSKTDDAPQPTGDQPAGEHPSNPNKSMSYRMQYQRKELVDMTKPKKGSDSR